MAQRETFIPMLEIRWPCLTLVPERIVGITGSIPHERKGSPALSLEQSIFWILLVPHVPGGQVQIGKVLNRSDMGSRPTADCIRLTMAAEQLSQTTPVLSFKAKLETSLVFLEHTVTRLMSSNRRAVLLQPISGGDKIADKRPPPRTLRR